MDIQIRNQQDSQKVDLTSLEQILRRALLYLKCQDKEVSVLLVDDEQIQQLNLQYRKKNSPTDVLAFRQRDDDSPLFDSAILGDIVISTPTAQRQAQEMGHSLERELKILLVHGLLHLLGYDHIEDKDAALMQPKEAELLSQINS